MYLIDKDQINEKLSPKIVEARVAHIFNAWDRVLVTSSFGTTSAVLLHLISLIKPDCPVYFIDTGYHFKETLKYKSRLSRLLGLNVIVLKPDSRQHKETEMQQMWSQDPDKCCNVNKTQPLNKIKKEYDIWMSGLIGFQNSHRNNLQIVDDQDEIVKFHPLIDWNSGLVEEYMESHGLPQHPLKEKGYYSVGCTHCTVPGVGRSGRWADQTKTECGLHR